jgi:hypothetical protein
VRFGGFDFFSDGKRAAFCTHDGDIWIVSGIDEKLDEHRVAAASPRACTRRSACRSSTTSDLHQRPRPDHPLPRPATATARPTTTRTSTTRLHVVGGLP